MAAGQHKGFEHGQTGFHKINGRFQIQNISFPNFRYPYLQSSQSEARMAAQVMSRSCHIEQKSPEHIVLCHIAQHADMGNQLIKLFRKPQYGRGFWVQAYRLPVLFSLIAGTCIDFHQQ